MTPVGQGGRDCVIPTVQMRRAGCRMGSGFPKVNLMESGRARVPCIGWDFHKEPGFLLLLRPDISRAQIRGWLKMV